MQPYTRPEINQLDRKYQKNPIAHASNTQSLNQLETQSHHNLEVSLQCHLLIPLLAHHRGERPEHGPLVLRRIPL